MIINLCARCRLMLMGLVYLRHERRLGGDGSCLLYIFFVVRNIIDLFISNEKIHFHNFFTYKFEVKMLTKLHNIQT